MDKTDKSVEKVLSKVTPDRRRFVQTILGLAGYGIPVVRTFTMGSAIGPVFATTVTTTAAPTTTRNAWRPSPHSLTSPILRTPPGGVSGSILKSNPSITDPKKRR